MLSAIHLQSFPSRAITIVSIAKMAEPIIIIIRHPGDKIPFPMLFHGSPKRKCRVSFHDTMFTE